MTDQPSPTAQGQPPWRGFHHLALVTPDLDATLRFYRDVLGMGELEMWVTPGGRGVILDAGRATLELLDERHAAEVDAIEVGRRVAGPVRFALEVPDSVATGEVLVRAGAQPVGGPVETPWRHRNVRVQAPDGMQLTLFTVLDGN